MNQHLSISNPVGNSLANWGPKVANWIQLAKACQLECLTNQRLTSSWQLATAFCGKCKYSVNPILP